VNCLHEIFFSAGIEQAKQLDAYFEKEKKPMGPLHGLPISLKDQFHVAGAETTMGYVGWIGTFEGQKGTGKEMIFESDLVRELRKLGAVLYCKTSVPQSLMTGETVNNIIGYTWNPNNRNLSCGGSSGGEGALITLKGSPLGIGSDIGGSVRIPAAFNGLYGLKPSTGRVPYQNVANSMDGQNLVLSALGPLANSVADLQLFMKNVMKTVPWTYDPLVVEIPWREEVARDVAVKKPTFGVFRFDGRVATQPPVTRAVNTVVDALKKKGYEVIEWTPPSHQRAVDLGVSHMLVPIRIRKTNSTQLEIWTLDGGLDIHSALDLSQEPPVRQIVGEFREASFEQQSATAIAKLSVQRRTYLKEYMEYWNGTAAVTESREPVDAVIMPVAPFAAARPERYFYYGRMFSPLSGGA
jgi:amidase